MLLKNTRIFIILAIAILAVIFSISGCKIPQEGFYTRCVEVKEKIPYDVIEVEFIYYDENTLFEDANLIFKGTVIDESEIVVESYHDGRLNITNCCSVSKFQIEKIFYSEDPFLKIGDLIKVSNPYCSYEWAEGTIKMEKNKQYIVLAEKAIDSFIEYTKCYDYHTADHYVSIVKVENGDYYVDEMLTSLISNARMAIVRKDGDFKSTVYVKGEEFEDELEALIVEKKGES